MLDFEVQRCTRRCCETDRALEPEETFYSALFVEGGDVVRRDYCPEAWQGPPEGVLGWWQSRMPSPSGRKVQLAPNDVLLQLFEQTGEQADQLDMRYVLALLLLRRRVLRQEESEWDDGREQLVVYCPKKDATWKVLVASPTAERIAQIQEQLAQLLFAEAA